MRKVTYTLLFLALTGPLTPLTGQSQPQANVLQRLMRDKVRDSQALLEGLALADFDKCRRSAEDLIRISKTAEWIILKTPEYDRHSQEFRRAAEAVVRKAKGKNIDGVALAYTDLVRTCVRCHQYVRRAREARLAPLWPGRMLAFSGKP
jgi:hypothetical protein